MKGPDSRTARPRLAVARGARALTWLAAAGAAFVLTSTVGSGRPATATAGTQETFRVPGDRVAIYNLAGRVEVRGGEGSEVSVAVRRGGADADRLRVERGPVEGFETLRVLYPDDRIVYRQGGWRGSSSLRVRENGTFYDDGRGGRKVTVAADGRGLEAHADLSVTIPPGKSVGVYLAVGEVTVTNVDGELRVDVGSADVSANGTRGSLIVDTGSGDVSVLDVEGDLLADTGSGSVEARGVRGEDVALDTGSGDVRGSRITATRLVVDTGSGDVELSEVRATELRVDTGSGSVTVALADDAEFVEVDTGSGSVELMLPDSFGATVEVETGSGGIEFDVPVQVHRVGRSHLEGSIGDGRGQLRVDTGSGSVRLRRG